MLALRNIARQAPRSAARISTRVARPQVAPRMASMFQPTWSAAPRLTSAFHMSAVRRQESDVQEELIAKLQNEIAMEEDMREDEDLSANIKEYLESSEFEIEDKPGQQEVTLTRKFGNETIRVTFSTADLNNTDETESPEDNAMYDNDVDEIIDGQSGGANTKGSVAKGKTANGNFRVAPEDRVGEEDEMDYDEEAGEDAEGFPAHVSIRIERPGKGALSIEATAQDGDFLIEDLAHLPTAELAEAGTAEANWARQALYTGPPFANLDEDLQILMEKYLEERGINTRMALFVPDYIDHKEQKEYIRWLKNIKSFVE